MQDLNAQIAQATQDRDEKAETKAKKLQAKADAEGDLKDTITRPMFSVFALFWSGPFSMQNHLCLMQKCVFRFPRRKTMRNHMEITSTSQF